MINYYYRKQYILSKTLLYRCMYERVLHHDLPRDMATITKISLLSNRQKRIVVTPGITGKQCSTVDVLCFLGHVLYAISASYIASVTLAP